MYYIKPKREKRKSRGRWLIIAIAVVLGFVIFDTVLENMIRDTAISRSRNIASQTINDAVIEVLENESFQYDDFVDIVSDENGSVKSVSTKASSVNSFKSELGRAVIATLENKDTAEVNIPLGTLTDIGILYGKGPNINIKIKLCGEMYTSLESTFVSAGINQTKHRISCHISADFAIITPSFTEYTTVKGEYLVAETIIIGDIPDSYTDVNGDDSGIIGQIFDYADVG